MSRFLWVEDFDGNTGQSLTARLWEGMIPGDCISEDVDDLVESLKEYDISITRTITQTLKIIADENELSKIDFIILDVDLPVTSTDDDTVKISKPAEQILSNFRRFYNGKDENLKKRAGYHLYLELIINKGFPKDNIIVLSAHLDQCRSLIAHCTEAKIPEINSYVKTVEVSGKGKDITQANVWVKNRYNRPYNILRTGINKACNHVRELVSVNMSENFTLNKFIKDGRRSDEIISNPEINNYIYNIDSFLHSKDPKPSIRNSYLQLLHNIVKYFEDRISVNRNYPKEIKAYATIAKFCRNWISHHVLSSLDEIDETDVAYVFMISLRAMFKLGVKPVRYEQYLFRLFSQDRLDINKIISKSDNNCLDSYCDLYQVLLNTHICANKGQGILNRSFYSAIDDLAKSNKRVKNINFIKLLYQFYWHDLSRLDGSHAQSLGTNQTFYCYNFFGSDQNEPQTFEHYLSRHTYKLAFE